MAQKPWTEHHPDVRDIYGSCTLEYAGASLMVAAPRDICPPPPVHTEQLKLDRFGDPVHAGKVDDWLEGHPNFVKLFQEFGLGGFYCAILLGCAYWVGKGVN